jgi:uncharacterized protein
VSATETADRVETVQRIYEAFGRGDVPVILDALAEDVRWEHWADWTPHRAGIAHLAPRTGREGAGEFFAIVGRWEIAEFAILDVMASERQVVAQVEIAATLPGGRRLRDEELHLWTFDDDGRVSAFRHYVDTAKHIEAAG